MRVVFASVILLLIVACASCGSKPSGENVKKTYTLTAGEKQLCDSLNIDTALIVLLREETSAKLGVFIPDPIWVVMDDGSTAEMPSNLAAIYFEANVNAAKKIIDELSEEFQAKGHTIYVCEENFGIDNVPDKVAIVPTTDKYAILQETGTDGINYDIDNDSLLKIIRVFDQKYDLTLIGANYDWCEFTFEKEPTNWLDMAEECYAVCPDIVDQGTGSVDELAEELKRTKTLYFWWD